jgi:hypothetical protein
MAGTMMASEAADKLTELVNEFGDYKLMLPDPWEDKWMNPVTDLRFDAERDAIVAVSET